MQLQPQEPSLARQLLDGILKATEDNDYANSIAEGDGGLKSGITTWMLERVSTQVSS